MSLKAELGVPEAHELRLVRSRTKGNMGQTEIYEYEEVTPDGTVVGKYVVTDHTELRGLKNTRTFEKITS